MYRPKKDPERVTFRCVVVGCTRSVWGATHGVAKDHAEETGWVRTGNGWVCDSHVRETRALAEVAGIRSWN